MMKTKFYVSLLILCIVSSCLVPSPPKFFTMELIGKNEDNSRNIIVQSDSLILKVTPKRNFMYFTQYVTVNNKSSEVLDIQKIKSTLYSKKIDTIHGDILINSSYGEISPNSKISIEINYNIHNVYKYSKREYEELFYRNDTILTNMKISKYSDYYEIFKYSGFKK